MTNNQTDYNTNCIHIAAAPGKIQGTITVAGVTTPIALTVNKAGGKYVLFGFTDDSGTPYNFLVIEK